MPPEFFNDGRGQYSKAFDVYSLGTVIKEILAGAAAVSIYGGCVVPLEKVIYNKEIIDVCLIQRDIYIIILLQQAGNRILGAKAGGGSRCAEIQGLRRASAAMLGF
jgi:hypothetical protein